MILESGYRSPYILIVCKIYLHSYNEGTTRCVKHVLHFFGRFHYVYARYKQKVRRPGVEPGSTAWKATMLTVTPPMLHISVPLSLLDNEHRLMTTRRLTLSEPPGDV
jgi:hypothetical protein